MLIPLLVFLFSANPDTTSYFSIGFEGIIGVNQTLYEFSNNPQYASQVKDIRDYRLGTDSSIIGHQFGLNLTYHPKILKNLGVGTGLYYINRSQGEKFHTSCWPSPSDCKFFYMNPTRANPPDYIKMVLHLKYISMPIRLKYDINFQNFSISPEAGLQWERMISGIAHYTEYDSEGEHQVKSDVAILFNKWGHTAYGSIKLSYAFSPQFTVSAGSYHSYSSSFVKSEISKYMKENIRTTGISIGLSKRIDFSILNTKSNENKHIKQ